MKTAGTCRRLVAFVTALLLLLCQTAVAAQACEHPLGSAYAADAQPPCHAEGEHKAPGSHGSHALTPCEAAKAVGEVCNVALADVTDLPALDVEPPRLHYAAASASQPRATNARWHPPPLTVLHCRMLN